MWAHWGHVIVARTFCEIVPYLWSTHFFQPSKYTVYRYSMISGGDFGEIYESGIKEYSSISTELLSTPLIAAIISVTLYASVCYFLFNIWPLMI